jgi:exonuclease III
MGINNCTLNVSKVETGDFCVKLYVKCKNGGFEWALVPVYGAAQDDHKAEFLAELARMGESDSFPILLGGDFNILHQREDKNNDNFRAIGLSCLMPLLRV